MFGGNVWWKCLVEMLVGNVWWKCFTKNLNRICVTVMEHAEKKVYTLWH
jgi:hypothetical protein